MTTQPYQFTPGSVLHIMEPDLNQEANGLPGYLSANPPPVLNESATLMRIMPSNVGEFGDVDKARLLFFRNQPLPL